jgi:putative membrane protein
MHAVWCRPAISRRRFACSAPSFVRLDEIARSHEFGRSALGDIHRLRKYVVSDPRVYFAAERTLLAWIRTGLTIMAFGFVVARFGLFLSLLALQRNVAMAVIDDSSRLSAFLGIALVVLGAAAILFAAFQHRRFVLSLPFADLPVFINRAFPLVVAALLGGLGLVLALYLAA